MQADDQKRAAAEAALDYIEVGDIIGVGTGSTVNHFIDALERIKGKVDGAVASSEASAQRLKKLNIPVLDLNQTGDLRIYVDGADEATRHLHLIKGGGAALTREKIVAEACEKFVCIIDQSKLVDVLGAFPLMRTAVSWPMGVVALKSAEPDLTQTLFMLYLSLSLFRNLYISLCPL